ncbi:CDP-glycerol glycerophosphotransferase family protein [Mammaliicoccus sciuri]|uniref:CDP-glycerol glycerophosphotransferase family protein n=1 Tax=Mammaliicoccus sciuri TaxID=1296 RepID=UPI001F1ADEC5|nr:CDP-glycerol glycerophosphotransferase family protein [Mammaliicoccus sciuri]MCE5040755.1 CDP-glycerol glycerophosphotransferase family protein [Mammaliicoccus sciuri]
MELLKIEHRYGWVIEEKLERIQLGIQFSKKRLTIESKMLNGGEHTLASIDTVDGLIAIITHDEFEYFIHVKSKIVYCTPYLNGDTKGSINLNINLKHSRFKLVKTKYSFYIIDDKSNLSFEINKSIFEISHKSYVIQAPRVKDEPYVYLSIKYCNYISFLEYTLLTKKISLKTINYSTLRNKDLKLGFKSANQLILKAGDVKETVKIKTLLEKKHLRLSDSFKGKLTFPAFFTVGNRLYVIIQNKVNNNIYVKFNTRTNLLFKYSDYEFIERPKFILIKGTLEYKENPYVTHLMTNKGIILGPLKWKNETEFSVKVKKKDLSNLKDIHNTLQFSKGSELIHFMKRYNKKPKTEIVKKTFISRNKATIIRLNMVNNISVSNVPKLPVYTKRHMFKINLAYKLSKVISPYLKQKNVNLYFEKEASRALESSKYVFEEVMKTNSNSSNKFILDKNSLQYDEMKRKWKKNIVKRFSFSHYLNIFLAKNFISSELSSHVISGRLFNDKLNEKIKDTPLYFLQHGIMFAKPVDNPMAAGFYKKNMVNNVVKNVISSDLEAKEFYKMGYDDSDLIKTGLPKLDGAILKDDADKITYMPTWRYWEESAILNGNIKDTTYFQSFVEIIYEFEKAGLIDRLQITAHNKFAEYIQDHMSEYSHLLCPDPTDALLNSKIFITDYSSIIYDAMYRGTFPIFYWKDSDYLIKNYKAIPPVNEENAPGAIVKSTHELIDTINNAIENNYAIPEEFINKYRKINEFHDNRNTIRVIKELEKNNVL